MTGPVALSVVIPTRNRPGTIGRAVGSVLASRHASFELVVIDQSDGDATEHALAQWRSDKRLRYGRTASKGRSHALNDGIERAQGELIAITDDDCEVDARWIGEMAAAFETGDMISIVFGSVRAGPHDAKEGFVPAYTREGTILARGLAEKHRIAGTSACIGLRRATWQSLNGFDICLGTGARFLAGEDADFVMRALSAGHAVYETPAPVVTHHGFYAWDRLAAVTWGYWYGTGVAFGKSLKLAPAQTILLLTRLARGWVGGAGSVAQSMGEDSIRWRRVQSFASGLVAGIVTATDRRTGHFRV